MIKNGDNVEAYQVCPFANSQQYASDSLESGTAHLAVGKRLETLSMLWVLDGNSCSKVKNTTTCLTLMCRKESRLSSCPSMFLVR